MEPKAYVIALAHRVSSAMRVSAAPLACLAASSADRAEASVKLEACEEWSAVWPPLATLQTAVAAAGLPPPALRPSVVLDVEGLMAPLVTSLITHLTTR